MRVLMQTVAINAIVAIHAKITYREKFTGGAMRDENR